MYAGDLNQVGAASQTRGILDDEFPKLEPSTMSICVTTNAPKASGVDSKTMEARGTRNQQALQSRASCDHGVQRGFGDVDRFKPELFKLREVKRLDKAFGEVEICDGGNTEGLREAKGSHGHCWWMR
jgi:hypothetical protein